MSYNNGKDVSTVVRPIPDKRAELGDTLKAAHHRRSTAHLLMTDGTELAPGDIWNGQPVTEEEAKVFFRPHIVSFIEG